MDLKPDVKSNYLQHYFDVKTSQFQFRRTISTSKQILGQFYMTEQIKVIDSADMKRNPSIREDIISPNATTESTNQMQIKT